ncbi:MAG: HD domain-containing phosphohydrolase [Candidatus Dormibacteraceae bacterium]
MARVLVVDDNPLNLELMSSYLGQIGVEMVSARNGEDALRQIGAVDLVLLDVMMPAPDGFEVCRRIRSSPKTSMLPVVMVTGLNQIDDRIKALEVGADDFISKPVERVEIIARVRSLLRVKSLLDRLDDSERVMFALARAVEAKDSRTEAHVERVGQMSRRLGERVGVIGRDLEVLFLGGVLHDIGKIGVPDAVLNKPGRLDEAEMAVARNHVLVGEQIVRPLRSAASVIPIVRHHHERIDGTGYPDRLDGEQIPILARIVSVCDCWDAMTSTRPYRQRLTSEQAAAQLRAGAGRQWDETMVNTFLSDSRGQTQTE